MARPNPESLSLTSRLLLKRWKHEIPEEVQNLEQTGLLFDSLQEANEQAIDLLYDLTVRQKKEYRTALEAAIEWSSLPDEPTQ